MRLAEKIRQRKNITVCDGNLKDIDGEIDRGLGHMPDFTPCTRTSVVVPVSRKSVGTMPAG